MSYKGYFFRPTSTGTKKPRAQVKHEKNPAPSDDMILTQCHQTVDEIRRWDYYAGISDVTIFLLPIAHIDLAVR